MAQWIADSTIPHRTARSARPPLVHTRYVFGIRGAIDDPT